MNEESQNTPEVENTGKRSYETFAEAMKTGTSEGVAKAREQVPVFKSGVANAIHDVAYGLAYGSVFTGAFINELIPKNIREGLAKGADAGKAAGRKACEKVHESLSSDDEIKTPEDTNPSFP